MSWLSDAWGWTKDELGSGLTDVQRFFGMAAPPSPDYQGAANKTTQANRPDQYNPFGYMTWSQDGNGNWTQNAGLNPQLQGAYNQFAQGLQGGDAARQQAQDAYYKQESSRLDPMFGQREQAMRSQLINQGLDPNSEAFRRQMDDFGRSRNDAYQSAINNSIAGGNQAMLQNFQMNMAGLQGLKGLMTPFGFSPSGDYLGAAQAQGQYGLADMQARQQFWQDMFSGGAALGKASQGPGAPSPGGPAASAGGAAALPPIP
jgi:hypothetical protein